MPDDAVPPIDLARWLDEGSWSLFQKWVLVFAALAFAVDGLANQVLGLAIPSLVRAWGARRDAFATVAALGLVGVTIGAATGGVLGDRLGRRSGLIGSVVLFGVMTAASAWSRDVVSLAVMRTLAGLGIGGALPNGAALISEFTPLRRRSLAIALGMVFIPIGGVLAGVIGGFVLPIYGWRALFVCCGVIPIAVGLVFLAVLPESPRFLLRRPHRHPELMRLLGRCGYGFAANSVLADASADQVAATPLSALFGQEARFDTVAIWVGFFFCLLASYTMFSWIPTMLANRGLGPAGTSFGMTAFNSGGMIGGLVGGGLIQHFGSRRSTLGLAAGAVAGALVLGFLPDSAWTLVWPGMTALVFQGVFLAGLHNGLYTLAAYIYPPFIRATGVGAAAAVGRIGAVLSAYTGVLSLELGGAAGYFVLIAISSALALVGVAFVRRHVPASGSTAERTVEALT